MSEQITGSSETKQIHELYPLYKLHGKEEVIIDNGDVTLRVTVDTLLGYIRDQIIISLGGDPTTGTGATWPPTGGSSGGPGGTVAASECIHVIREGESLPAESRLDNHYYLRRCNTVDAKLSAGLYKLIRVSPNMGLRLIVD